MQEERKPNVSIIEWMGTLLVFAIPVVNLIMAVVWAITAKKKSKRNFALAWLVWFVIFCALLVVTLWFFHQPILEWLAQWNANTQTILPSA